MSINDGPHLAGCASVLTWRGTAETHIALAAIVSSATPATGAATSACLPVAASPPTSSPTTSSPSATSPSASASSKERLTFLRRHLLQSRANRLTLVVTPTTSLAPGVCAGGVGGARGRSAFSTRRRPALATT
jgi:hypothetical protein